MSLYDAFQPYKVAKTIGKSFSFDAGKYLTFSGLTIIFPVLFVCFSGSDFFPCSYFDRGRVSKL